MSAKCKGGRGEKNRRPPEEAAGQLSGLRNDQKNSIRPNEGAISLFWSVPSTLSWVTA